MCRITIVHYSFCDIRPYITFEPLTSDLAAVFVDPHSLQPHRCSNSVTRLMLDLSKGGAPRGGFFYCPAHRCCVSLKHYTPCESRLEKDGQDHDCANRWVHNQYNPITEVASNKIAVGLSLTSPLCGNSVVARIPKPFFTRVLC